jgi:integrase
MPLCWALAQPGRWPTPPTTPACTSAGRPSASGGKTCSTSSLTRQAYEPQTPQILMNLLAAPAELRRKRGLRRGEAAGLRWADLDLDAGTLTVTGQLQQLGGRLVAARSKHSRLTAGRSHAGATRMARRWHAGRR